MRIDMYDERHMQLRKELKAMRIAAGLSQEDLAIHLGTKQPIISKYERGERNLDFIEVVKVCRACGYDPSVLIKNLKL